MFPFPSVIIDPKWESVFNWNAGVVELAGGAGAGGVGLPYPPPELFEHETSVLETMIKRNGININFKRMIRVIVN